jgi:hypothetical protein
MKVIYKLELKEHQATQRSEGLLLTNSNIYHSKSAFGIQVSVRTSGPALMVIHKQDSIMVFMGHTYW